MKIKIPTVITTEILELAFRGQREMKYTDEELGAAIAAYRMAEQFLMFSGLYSAALRVVRMELDSLNRLRDAREQKS